jgi:hypothetical protein
MNCGQRCGITRNDKKVNGCGKFEMNFIEPNRGGEPSQHYYSTNVLSHKGFRQITEFFKIPQFPLNRHELAILSG